MSNEEDNEKNSPLFMQELAARPHGGLPAPNPNKKNARTADTAIGDHILNPTTPLNARQRVAAMMLATGSTDREVRKKLKYNAQYFSYIKGSAKFKKEVTRVQDRMYEKSIDDRLKELGPEAMDIIEAHLADPAISAGKKTADAKWLIEKLTGKPAQAINVKGEVSIGNFMDVLDKLKSQGKVIDVKSEHSNGDIQDAEFTEVEAVDELAAWVDDNI